MAEITYQDAVKLWPSGGLENDQIENFVKDPPGKNKAQATFMQQTLTIARTFPGDKYGLKFQEDPMEGIWNISGEWDGSRYKPYEGFKYQSSQVVDVVLKISWGQDGSLWRTIIPWKISLSQNSPAPQTKEQATDAQEEQAVANATTEYVDKWDLKDIHIRKAQAENILNSVLRIPSEERMLKVLQAMGFKDFDEANEAHGYAYSLLRRGKPVELPVAVSDMEEEATEEEETPVKEENGETVEQLEW
tara:strand:+ start:4106 stop:4846 length:741 start_codon:yes stop_codon:yes gene_type:complete